MNAVGHYDLPVVVDTLNNGPSPSVATSKHTLQPQLAF